MAERKWTEEEFKQFLKEYLEIERHQIPAVTVVGEAKPEYAEAQAKWEKEAAEYLKRMFEERGLKPQ